MEGEIPSSTKKMINGWFFMGESSKKMVDFPVPCLIMFDYGMVSNKIGMLTDPRVVQEVGYALDRI